MPDYALHDAVQLVPRKDLDALPVAFQDGRGMGSIPNWSCPPQGQSLAFSAQEVVGDALRTWLPPEAPFTHCFRSSYLPVFGLRDLWLSQGV